MTIYSAKHSFAKSQPKMAELKGIGSAGLGFTNTMVFTPLFSFLSTFGYAFQFFWFAGEYGYT